MVLLPYQPFGNGGSQTAFQRVGLHFPRLQPAERVKKGHDLDKNGKQLKY